MKVPNHHHHHHQFIFKHLLHPMNHHYHQKHQQQLTKELKNLPEKTPHSKTKANTKNKINTLQTKRKQKLPTKNIQFLALQTQKSYLQGV